MTPNENEAATEQPARQDAAYAELRALAEKATPGPWHAPGMGEIHAENHDEIAGICFSQEDGDCFCGIEDDAAYIAAANPAAILALLADNNRLTERVRDLETAANCIVAVVVSALAKERAAQDERVAVLEAERDQVRNNAFEEAAAIWDGQSNVQSHISRAIRALKTTPHPHADEAAKIEWMPIETAPKDTAVLLYCGSYYDIGHFNTALERWVDCANHHPVKPTRWHPLPAPPSPAEGEKS